MIAAFLGLICESDVVREILELLINQELFQVLKLINLKMTSLIIVCCVNFAMRSQVLSSLISKSVFFSSNVSFKTASCSVQFWEYFPGTKIGYFGVVEWRWLYEYILLVYSFDCRCVNNWECYWFYVIILISLILKN